MSGTDSTDGWTDRARCGRTLGVRHRNILNQVAMEPSLKTEAPGLRGVGQALGPQAWPIPPPPCPTPSIYSRKSYVGGAGARLERRKREGRGREQART